MKRNWIGERFGRLLVMAVSRNGTHTKPKILLCKCDCGKITEKPHTSLVTGATKSCGCLNRDSLSKRSRTHAMSNTPSWLVWVSMKARCYNSKNKDYKYYGGRGITVCDEWKNSFVNFFRDMGKKPDGLEIDRTDNNLGYFKDNCRWVTHKQNCRNYRQNRILTIGKESLSLVEWSEKTGVSANLIRHRVNNGWPKEHWFLPKFHPHKHEQLMLCS